MLKFKNDWLNQINGVHGPSGTCGNKLRTYCTFKHEYGVAKYCNMIIPKCHRSALCKFRRDLPHYVLKVADLKICQLRYVFALFVMLTVPV